MLNVFRAYGVDGLILVAAGAGGHAGTLNPMPFIGEVREFFDKNILLSGCISTGGDIASAIQMCADLTYMGARFINTKESETPQDYRQMIIDSGASDVVYAAAVSGVNANFLRPCLEAMGITEQMWKQSGKVDFGSELTAGDEAKSWKTIWSAGQGVTKITDSPSVGELVERLKKEFRSAIQEQATLLGRY